MRSTYTQSPYATQIQAGYDVYGSDGEKIGMVAGAQYQQSPGYFTLEKGFLFPTQMYVPLTAITRVEGEDIYLNVPKDAVQDQGWDATPPDQTDQSMDDAAGH